MEGLRGHRRLSGEVQGESQASEVQLLEFLLFVSPLLLEN